MAPFGKVMGWSDYLGAGAGFGRSKEQEQGQKQEPQKSPDVA